MAGAITSTGTIRGAQATSDVTRSDAASSMGQDTFLKLLVAQMQHQDPLQPTDSAAMMSQLAQFSSVEGLNKLNSQLTALNVSQDFTASIAMIGKSVTYTDGQGNAQTGVVAGVRPTSSGAQLEVGSSWIYSGQIGSVQ